MTPLRILVTSMSFRFEVLPNGQLLNHPASIGSALNQFTIWFFDRRFKRQMPGKRYRYYNKKTNTVYLPRYYLKTFLGFLETKGVPYRIETLKPPPGADIKFNMIPGFKPKNSRQRDAIEHLIRSPDAVKGIALQTGVGKSVTTLKHICDVGKRALIGAQGITEQWERAIAEWTDLGPDDVYVLKGMPSVTKLLTRIDESLFPKIILYSIGTLRQYSQDSSSYENYPSFDELATLLNVGIRVTDESHLNFHTNFIMDLRLNVASTVVLTATFDVSDSAVKRIFDSHYPPSIRFGESDYKTYVKVSAYGYSSENIPTYAYMGPDGYSHVRLEKWLLFPKQRGRLDWIFRRIYLPIVQGHYDNIRKPGERCLVLCETVNMCVYLVEKFRREFPNYAVNIYVGETDDEILTISDIIVSTTRSSGTARDIKRLRTMLQTTSVSSAPANVQNLGRLRELDHSDAPEFIYLFNKAIPKQIEYHNTREGLFRPRSLSFKVIDLAP